MYAYIHVYEYVCMCFPLTCVEILEVGHPDRCNRVHAPWLFLQSTIVCLSGSSQKLGAGFVERRPCKALDNSMTHSLEDLKT